MVTKSVRSRGRERDVPRQCGSTAVAKGRTRGSGEMLDKIPGTRAQDQKIGRLALADDGQRAYGPTGR